MKIKIKALLISSIIFIASSAYSQNSFKIITLKDGSVLKGQILTVYDDIYKIQTSNIGTVEINGSDIVNISSNSSKKEFQQETPDPQGIKQKVQNMQTLMFTDPEIMAEIQSLAQDPQVLQILSDPEFLKAVTSYDSNKIMASDRTNQLMANPKINKLINLIREKIGQ